MVALSCCHRRQLCGSVDKTAPDTYRTYRRSDVDGPYAWIVVLASFFGHVLIYGVLWSSGVFYDIFREIFDGPSWMISLIATLSTTFTFGFSPLPSVLINRYGQRSITIIGGGIAGSGLILSAYATNFYYLAISFGMITGLGFGTAYLALISIVPLYFEKYRSIALGVAVSGAGIGTFVYPPFIRFLVHSVGIRGSLLMTGGVTLNLCVCGALMRPVRKPKPDQVQAKHGSSDVPTKADTSTSSVPPTNQTRKCLSLLNLFVFKKKLFLVLCLNNFLGLFGIGIVYVHLTAYSETKNVSKDTAAMLISAVGIANFFGRPMFGVLAKLRCGAIVLYGGAFTLGGVVVILMPVVQRFAHLVVLAAAFGFLTAAIGPLLPQIIAECLSVELVPSAYGYLLVFEAAGSLLGPPAAGWLYDVLAYYPPSFYLSGSALAISGIVLSPYFIKVPASKRQEIIIDVNDGSKKVPTDEEKSLVLS